MLLVLALVLLSPVPSLCLVRRELRWGKYFSYDQRTGEKSWASSTLYLYSPDNVTGRLPLVLEFHGGGFTGGSASSKPTPVIEAHVAAGFHYASMDYRLVATKYYFNDENGTETEEEFLQVTEDGTITPVAGAPLSSYAVRVGRQEFVTKCVYDAAQGFESLLSHAEQWGIDPHRVGLTGSSAGGAEIHYLAWTYHGIGGNAARYTPVSMVYTMAQLDYPVQNMLDETWGIWASELGEGVALSSILSKPDCGEVVGNPWCASDSQPSQTDLCNATWHAKTMARHCDGAAFENATLGSVRDAQVWPLSTAQDRGLATLWYPSAAMKRTNTPRPFFIYVSNALNDTSGGAVVHAALYARRYARVAEAAGIDYVTYYTDYIGMRDGDKGSERLQRGNRVYNYRASFDFQVPEAKRNSAAEQVLFHCHAFGLDDCDGGGGGGADWDACGAKLQALGCPRSGDDCPSCIRANAAALMANGCPKGQGAAAEVNQFWCTQSHIN